MQLNFIDTTKWDFYNRVYKYVRTKRMPYVDDLEQKRIREAAPLIKFTYSKSVRAAELEMVNNLLLVADNMDASAVIVCEKRIQFMTRNILRDVTLIDKLLAPSEDRYHFCSRMDPSCNMIELYKTSSWSGRDKTLTPVDSQVDGMYVKQADTWGRIINNEKIVDHIDSLGFVSRPGRPPSAVNSRECDKATINQIQQIVDLCKNFGLKSQWTQTFIKEAQRMIRLYRTSNIKELRKAVKSMLPLKIA